MHLQRLRLLIPWLAGIVEALLAARLVARLLAARPDNPAVQILSLLTNPFIAPLSRLDAHQPRFGAVLELSTLTLLLLIPLASYLLWKLWKKPHVDSVE